MIKSAGACQECGNPVPKDSLSVINGRKLCRVCFSKEEKILEKKESQSPPDKFPES